MDSGIQIKLWLLQREEAPMIDEFSTFIIAAATEKEAREIANSECGGEDYIWTDGTKTACYLVASQVEDGFEGVLAKTRE